MALWHKDASGNMYRGTEKEAPNGNDPGSWNNPIQDAAAPAPGQAGQSTPEGWYSADGTFHPKKAPVDVMQALKNAQAQMDQVMGKGPNGETLSTVEGMEKGYRVTNPAYEQQINEGTVKNLGGYRNYRDFLVAGGAGPGVPGWAQSEIDRARGLQGSPFDTQYIDALRSQQADAIKMLRDQAEGKNSVVDAAAKKQQDDIAAAIASRAASAPGRYNPAIQRQALQQTSSTGQDLASSVFANKVAEQNAAQQALMQALSQQRAAEWAQTQGMTQSDRDFLLKKEALGQGWGGMGLEDKNQQYKNLLDLRRIMAGQQSAEAQAAAAEKQSNYALGGQIGTGLAGLALSAASMFGHSSPKEIVGASGGGSPNLDESPDSVWGTTDEDKNPWSDVRAKTNIRNAEPDLEKLSQALAQKGQNAYSYVKAFGGGRGSGPMTQDLEKAGPVGKAIVGKDENGVGFIKGDRALTAALGLIGHQQQQINELREAVGQDTKKPRQTKAQKQAEVASTYEALGMPGPRLATPPVRAPGDRAVKVWDERTQQWHNRADPAVVARVFNGRKLNPLTGELHNQADPAVVARQFGPAPAPAPQDPNDIAAALAYMGR